MVGFEPSIEVLVPYDDFGLMPITTGRCPWLPSLRTTCEQLRGEENRVVVPKRHQIKRRYPPRGSGFFPIMAGFLGPADVVIAVEQS